MRGNAAFWVLTTLGLGAAFGLPLVNVAPNRLVSGEGVSFWQVWQTLAAPTNVTEPAAHWPLWLFTITLLLLLALSLAVALRWVGDPPRWAGGLLLAGVCALMPGLLLL